MWNVNKCINRIQWFSTLTYFTLSSENSMFKLRRFNILWKISSFEFDGRKTSKNKLAWGQHKAGKVSGTKRKQLGEHQVWVENDGNKFTSLQKEKLQNTIRILRLWSSHHLKYRISSDPENPEKPASTTEANMISGCLRSVVPHYGAMVCQATKKPCVNMMQKAFSVQRLIKMD